MPQKREARLDRRHETLPWMHMQPQLLTVRPNPLLHRVQRRLLLMKHQNVVHIPNIPRCPPFFLHQMIQRIQIHVGKELTGLIANRQPLGPQDRREQIVAWKIGGPHGEFLMTGQNGLNEPQHLIIPNSSLDRSEQEMMVDAGKIVRKITFQDVTVPSREGRGPFNRGMRPFSLSTGVRIMKKASIKDRLHHIAQRVMHHAIAKGRALIIRGFLS